MVLDLTLKCNEGCTHCFVNADDKGAHMTHETVEQAGEFCSRLGLIMLQVTGGEFTLHPNYVTEIMNLAVMIPNTQIILESNGWWFEDKEHVENIRSLLRIDNIFALQIRTDQRYYPNYGRIWGARQKIEALHRKIHVYEGEIILVPLGRAKNLVSENPEKSPMCANLLMLSRQLGPDKPLRYLINFLEMNGKFSTPSIGVNGDIHAGESCLCMKIGHVTDSYETVMDNIRKTQMCGRCNLKINPEHLRRI